MLLGIFAKFPDLEPVKTRLQSQLSAAQAAAFHLAAVADALETACRVVPHPVLFLSRGAESPAAAGETLQASGLAPAAWTSVRVEPQQGADLGARLEHAFEVLCASAAHAPALVLGSDSPSLTPPMLQAALQRLAHTDTVLGPTADGGYWCIGVRRPHAGLLADLPWSTPRTFAATRARCESWGLSVGVLDAWTDVDEPGDLAVLGRQIAALRRQGDAQTARHSERVLRSLGVAPPAPARPDAG